ncbi:MAG: hypothetical protein ACR2RL_05145 [Gammaproteobacteria bacterium]
MSVKQSDMERMQIIVSREQKVRMKQLANEAKCSVSEIYRRAADAYSVAEDDDEIHHPELEALVEALEAGTRRANAAIDRAEREVAATLDFYQARQQTREARAQVDSEAQTA